MELENSTIDIPGVNDALFEVVHSVALTTLGVSFMACVVVLVHLRYGCDAFYKKALADRLVFYLAVTDLLYCSNHMIDHVIMIITREHPIPVICTTTGFFLQLFASTQSIIVAFTALNACALVVLQRRLETGVADWRLLLGAVAPPAIWGTIWASLGLMGPSEAWCMADIRKKEGLIINNIISAVMLTVFMVDIISYSLVWVKIKQSQQKIKTKNDSNKLKSAKIMTIFVMAYVLQWFPFMLYSIWSFIERAPGWLLVTNTLFCNTGGLCNAIAYTVIRQYYISPKSKRISNEKQSPKLLITKASGESHAVGQVSKPY